MRIAIACDHRGFDLKQAVIRSLESGRHAVHDLGTYSRRPVDYPDYAEKVGLAIREGRSERGILICGSGVGVAIAANKLPGVRASLCHDIYSAHQGVEHDDMNVLVLGAWVVAERLAEELVQGFIQARFIRDERYLRRLGKVQELEERYRSRDLPLSIIPRRRAA